MNMRTVLVCMVLLIGAFGVASGQTTLVMNEIYSRGVTNNADWIEVYNPTAVTIDLAGYKLYDAGGQVGTKPKRLFPSGATVPPKGFYVMVTDSQYNVSDQSNYGLSSTGETVWLENGTGTIIDSVAFPAMPLLTQTYGRGPNGGAWTLLNTITCWQSNGSIVMNEIQSRGVAGNLDWIEVYNSVSASVNISAYKIYDSGGQGGTKPKKPFPAGTILPANGFYVIITDTASFPGDLSGFGLSSSGEWVWLQDSTTGVITDSVNFGATVNATQSYGRYPDGGAWQVLNLVTRGTTNNTAVSVGDEPLIATEYRLSQNYPNPFNPATVITYQVPVVSRPSSVVSLKVYDLLGREVATLVNEAKQPGTYQVRFDGSGLTSGVYVYRLSTGGVHETRRMVLVK